MAMKTAWTAYIKDVDRKKEIKQSFLASLVMRKRLIEILLRKQTGSLKNSRLEGGYDAPNWALKQADARGYERAIDEIISLLED